MRERRGDNYVLDFAAADREIADAKLCGTLFKSWKHRPCGARIATKDRCQRRSCPHCSHVRAAGLKAQYEELVSRFKRPAMLTFTVPNVQTAQALLTAVSLLVKGFERLRRRACWPDCVPGLWALEIVWSAEKGYHPHLHCIIDAPWLDLAAISTAWTELTGAKHQPDLKRALGDLRVGLLSEGIKYVMKCWELRGDGADVHDASGTEPLRAVIAILAGRRAVNLFGGLKLPEKPKKKAYELSCPGCGAPFNPRRYGWEWELCYVSAEEFMAMATGPLWANVYQGFAIRPSG